MQNLEHICKEPEEVGLLCFPILWLPAVTEALGSSDTLVPVHFCLWPIVLPGFLSSGFRYLFYLHIAAISIFFNFMLIQGVLYIASNPLQNDGWVEVKNLRKT